jgi:hypothetical protein
MDGEARRSPSALKRKLRMCPVPMRSRTVRPNVEPFHRMIAPCSDPDASQRPFG